MTAQELVDQENVIKSHWEAGDIPYLCHLMGGNEEQLVEIFKDIHPDDFVFCSHRCHFHYSLHGGTDLVEKVLNGRSMFLYSKTFICSAIVGGICSIACGVALGFQIQKSPRKVWAFVGDGATDEGSFWEAVRFAEGRDLPITFIVEDNGAQCGVSRKQRFGEEFVWGDSLYAELCHYQCVKYYRYIPVYPHAGNLGPDGKPTRPPIKFPIERIGEKGV